MEVTINGVHYEPLSTSTSIIGIALSTHNRKDVLNQALDHHLKHLPARAMIVVIDDGSKPAVVVPDSVQLLRHETSLGIVASKNASLSALMDDAVGDAIRNALKPAGMIWSSLQSCQH